MEHKKSGIENIKILFGDFLDEVSMCQSDMSDKMEALKEQVVLLQEEVIRYKNKVEGLEETVIELRSIAANVKPIDLGKEIEDDRQAPQQEAVLVETEPQQEIVPELETVSEQETALELEVVPNEEVWPQGDNEPGFLLDEEPEPESVLPEERIDTVGDLFSQPEPLQQELFQQEPLREGRSVIGGEQKILLEAVRPDWYDWEVDYPAPYLENIAEGIGFNDRILFLKELFEGDDQLFKSVVMRLNEMDLFSEAVEYLRAEFPNWDEQSDEVYRFYMNVRRKLRK